MTQSGLSQTPFQVLCLLFLYVAPSGAAMRRREFITLIGGVAATWPLTVQAQQPVLPVVGLLRTEARDSFIAAFRRGLSDSGYTDGKNVTVDIRVAEGKRDRLSELAADLVRKRVAAIVVNTNAVPFAISATKSIPIVFVTGLDTRLSLQHFDRA
jgi:putative tryptophan/tyrosine transport system substrate-binding protein